MNRQPGTSAIIHAGTATARSRCKRIAPLYDLLDGGMEWRFSPWRRASWVRVEPDRAREAGTGAGKNRPTSHTPQDAMPGEASMTGRYPSGKRPYKTLGRQTRFGLSTREAAARRRETMREEPLPLQTHSDGSLVHLEPGSWFVCFVPPIDRQWWHPLLHGVHKHVFALRPEPNGYWTLFEPWWTRLLTATIATVQAEKFLRWGGWGDVLLVRESIPGHSSQLRGLMTCGALAAHLLGRRYWVWTPHQLYRLLLREPNVCHVEVSALLARDISHLGDSGTRVVQLCVECGGERPRRRAGAAKPFCVCCGRDLDSGWMHPSVHRKPKGPYRHRVAPRKGMRMANKRVGER